MLKFWLTLWAAAVKGLAGCAWLFFSSVPSYLQLRLHNRGTRVRDFHAAYHHLIQASSSFLRILLTSAIPGTLLLYIGLAMAVGLLFSFAQVVSLTANVVYVIGLLSLGIGVLSLLALIGGLAVFLYRELKDVLPSRFGNTDSTGQSSTGSSTQSTRQLSSSQTRNCTRSTSKRSTTSRQSAKRKAHKQPKQRPDGPTLEDVADIKLPTGDIHDVEVDEYGDIR